jgi:transcriptional regulator with XRE-family HTH domain
MKRLDIAKKIRALRLKLKLNQKKFGKLAGLSQQMISKLESGESGYTLGVLEKIASRTGVKLKLDFKTAGPRLRDKTLPAISVFHSERDEILSNIRWFSRLDPLQKIKAVEINNQATRRLLHG